MSLPLLLVVDDDEDIREAIELALGPEGYRVLTAGDGADAWAFLEEGVTPNLILLDLMMPRWDGERFLTELAASAHASIPVVVMSGHDTAAKRARALGAAEILPKPVDLDTLLATVARYCTRQDIEVTAHP